MQMLPAVENIAMNTQNLWGQTPLHITTKLGHIECVKALLQHENVDVNIRDKDGRTAFSETDSQWIQNREEIAALFLQHGATLN